MNLIDVDNEEDGMSDPDAADMESGQVRGNYIIIDSILLIYWA